MPTPPKGARLGGGPAHERLILANLATQLFEHQSITTTLARAKRLRPYAERLITFAKRGDLASRRRVMRVIRDKAVVHELFTEIGPTMAERQGGYTRIIKIGPRKGDGAPMAVIQLVLEAVKPSKKRAIVKDSAGTSPDDQAKEKADRDSDRDKAVEAEDAAAAVDADDAEDVEDTDEAAEAAENEDSEAAAETDDAAGEAKDTKKD